MDQVTLTENYIPSGVTSGVRGVTPSHYPRNFSQLKFNFGSSSGRISKVLLPHCPTISEILITPNNVPQTIKQAERKYILLNQ